MGPVRAFAFSPEDATLLPTPPFTLHYFLIHKPFVGSGDAEGGRRE